jgi:hypothetical protein
MDSNLLFLGVVGPSLAEDVLCYVVVVVVLSGPFAAACCGWQIFQLPPGGPSAVVCCGWLVSAIPVRAVWWGVGKQVDC